MTWHQIKLNCIILIQIISKLLFFLFQWIRKLNYYKIQCNKFHTHFENVMLIFLASLSRRTFLFMDELNFCHVVHANLTFSSFSKSCTSKPTQRQQPHNTSSLADNQHFVHKLQHKRESQ